MGGDPRNIGDAVSAAVAVVEMRVVGKHDVVVVVAMVTVVAALAKLENMDRRFSDSEFLRLGGLLPFGVIL